MILSAQGVRAEWDGGCGHLPSLVIDGAPVLWSAPWRDDPAIAVDPDIPPVERSLGGTFTCTPFGHDDVNNGPLHGLSANAPWRIIRAVPSALTATRHVAHGQITARIALRDCHPVLYQTHMLDLTAPCTFAHHPMFHLADGGRLSATPQATLTFAAEAPFHPQHSRFEGFPDSLRDYPDAPCEDFLTLVDGPGWTALARHAENDTILTLRRADQLPATNIWISNGARAQPPWSGVRGIIGIEDAICAGAERFAAALDANRVTEEGVATALLPGRHVIAHAIARIPGCHDIRSVTPGPDSLTMRTAAETITIPFDGTHFQ